MDEFIHRFNSRKLKDADRFTLSFANVERRLTYKALIAVKEKTANEVIYTPKTNIKSKAVIQLKYGEIIATYTSVAEAAKLTGISQSNIDKTVKGKRSNAGGFKWIYA